MRRTLSIIIVGGIIAALGCAQSAGNSSQESAIRDLVQKYVNARNSRDADATRSLFTTDADQLVSTGEWRKGIDSLIKGAMASSMKETGTSSISVESVRFLEPDIAIADGRYETTTAGNSANRKMWTTLVMKRTDAGWRIAAIRNMLPSPNTPPSSR
jgi:uncharacterized protein (TIGR02246 family)